MTIIDTHAHIYPDPIATKAAASIAEFYNIPVCMNGTLSMLLKRGKEAGISRFLIHSVAVTSQRVQHINDYLGRTAKQLPDKLIGFGSLHPDYATPRKELERMKALGLRGVKLHPDFQQFYLDSPKALALFEQMADLDMPLLTHVGDTRYPFSHPQRMANVMDQIPTLKVIAAHLGGWSIWKEGFQHLAGRPNLWVDSCSSLYALPPTTAADIIHHYGTDRVFFGTDYPMWDPLEEVERMKALPLTAEEQENVFHCNFERFLANLKK